MKSAENTARKRLICPITVFMLVILYWYTVHSQTTGNSSITLRLNVANKRDAGHVSSRTLAQSTLLQRVRRETETRGLGKYFKANYVCTVGDVGMRFVQHVYRVYCRFCRTPCIYHLARKGTTDGTCRGPKFLLIDPKDHATTIV